MSDGLFPFEILEIPASGAFATLCLARAADGRIVACKVLKKDFVSNADALTRMRDEARLLTRLDHPGIVDVYDLLNLDGRPVLVMEYVEGLDLGTLLRALPDGVPAPVACAIIRGAAEALHAGYSNPGRDGTALHVIHRDLKPDNLMIDVTGQVKVLDFGTAKGTFTDRESMTTAMVMGSRGYMSPERLMGEQDTSAVDVYALGLTFLQLLTGKLPVISRHPKKHDPAVEKAIARVHSDEVPDLDALHDLLRAMASFDAAARPTCSDVVRELDTVVGAQPADLVSFARAEVRPRVDERPRHAPEAHPDYHDLTFLGTAGSWETLSNPDVTEEQSDGALRAFLKHPDWAERVSDLQLLLTGSARWTPGPFLEVLHKAHTPWWQVWQKRPSDAQLAVALEFLKQRSDEPAVVALAEPFLDHADERIRNAARSIHSG